MSGGRWLSIESRRIGSRMGFRAQRAGGTTEWMRGGRVEIIATFWRRKGHGAEMKPEEFADVVAYLESLKEGGKK